MQELPAFPANLSPAAQDLLVCCLQTYVGPPSEQSTRVMVSSGCLALYSQPATQNAASLQRRPHRGPSPTRTAPNEGLDRVGRSCSTLHRPSGLSLAIKHTQRPTPIVACGIQGIGHRAYRGRCIGPTCEGRLEGALLLRSSVKMEDYNSMAFPTQASHTLYAAPARRPPQPMSLHAPTRRAPAGQRRAHAGANEDED